MTLPLVAFVLAAPVLLLLAALVALVEHGPLGWLGAAALIGTVWYALQRSCRRCWAWWLGTKAPVREVVTGRRPRDWQ